MFLVYIVKLRFLQLLSILVSVCMTFACQPTLDSNAIFDDYYFVQLSSGEITLMLV